MNVSFHVKTANDAPVLKPIGILKRRPRSESLDIRVSSQACEYSGEELGIKREELEEQPIIHRRRRSASCSVPSSPRIGDGAFDPILEEPVGQELERVLEGDSAR